MRRFSSAELFAVLVSLASVTISVLGNRTQERLLAASVWPYLSFTSGNTSDDGRKVVALAVANAGNGPARVRRFSVEYRGREIASASDLLDQCCGFRPPSLVTSPVVGKVLRPGEQVTLMQLPLAPDFADGWGRLDRARFEFVFSACYCSTLDECWNVRSDQDDPKPALTCPGMPRDQQWHG